VDFSTLEEAFGSSSLGIIIVKDLPAKFVELRHKLLSYSSYLANLPAEELSRCLLYHLKYHFERHFKRHFNRLPLYPFQRVQKEVKSNLSTFQSVYQTISRFPIRLSSYPYPPIASAPLIHPNSYPPASLESPDSHYLVGWSCGKETLKSGIYDTLKGSYYVNCAPAFASTRASVAAAYPSFPEYTAPNVWPPSNLLPFFEETFRQLCDLIVETAVLVARACDTYAVAKVEGYEPGYLEHVVKSSVSTKARLLHYFPPSSPSSTLSTNPSSTETPATADDDDWCATHLDHGCLTGLTSAMFVDEAAHPPLLPSSTSISSLPSLPELPSSPDPAAGLYIRSRADVVTKVSIPRDCLGFQTGEALEVITKGKFRAVPHFVKGAAAKGGKVARNTLAVFTQPNLGDVVEKDSGKDFARFAREIVERNH
jgi:hypothetical protein